MLHNVSFVMFVLIKVKNKLSRNKHINLGLTIVCNNNVSSIKMAKNLVFHVVVLQLCTKGDVKRN